ncbi:MAG: methyltransferase domain-containing protein [Bacteroidetes bacterium]|nr:MAG: methyltransferase domain-containing protein [Bacteroidota bacterium]
MVLDYLSKKYDWTDPRTAAILDETSLWSSAFSRLLLNHIPLKPNVRLLDIGTGTGVPLFELAHRLGESAHLTGIDLQPAFLERAKWKKSFFGLENVELVQGDATQLPFEDGTFDLVVSNLGINNFADPERAVAEAFRVLKKGGRLILTTNLEGHFREFYSVFEAVLRDLRFGDIAGKVSALEARRGTVESVRELVENAGFSIPKIVREYDAMRYLDGSAFLRHPLIIYGFLPDLRSLISPENEVAIFSEVETRLNEEARWSGELKMSVPMLYVEGLK